MVKHCCPLGMFLLFLLSSFNCLFFRLLGSKFPNDDDKHSGGDNNVDQGTKLRQVLLGLYAIFFCFFFQLTTLF
jgi:hypothetical protein